MSAQWLRTLKQRREDVNRRIDALRSQLAVEEARAEEIENLWKEIVAEQPQPSEDRVVHISAPRVAVSAPSTVTDFIIQALMELEEAGYEGADRAAVVKIVSRNAPKIKPNTVRVSFSRLLKQGRIERVGKLYRLPQT